jgi:hypothetical protein
VPLSLSTLADQVSACAAAPEPLLTRIEAHIFAAVQLHGDDTTVPVLAKGKTDIARCWTCVRDDRLFEIDRAINGRPVEQRLAARQELSKPLLDELHAWMVGRRDRQQAKNLVANIALYREPT